MPAYITQEDVEKTNHSSGGVRELEMRKIKIIVICIATFILGFLFCLAITFEELKVGWGLLNGQERMRTTEVGGSYNSEYGWMICETELSCVHEIGHWKDDKKGKISNTPEFRQAINNFVISCAEGQDILCYILVRFPGISGNELAERGWGGYREVYATVYMLNVFENISLPNTLSEFYE